MFIFYVTNVVCEKIEVKPQLVVGGIYLVTGRFLATVGDWGNKIVPGFCRGTSNFSYNSSFLNPIRVRGKDFF